MNDSDLLQLSVSLDRPQLARGAPGLVHMVACVTAAPAGPSFRRAPLDLALAIDTSGSMEGEKLRHVVASLEFLLERLQPADRLALVGFSNVPRVLLPLTPAGPSLLAHARFVLSQVRAGGGTNVEAGLVAGGQLLEPRGAERVNGLLLLSDGIPNVGAMTARALAAVVRPLRSHLSVSTLGYGEDHAEELLSELAEAGGGTYAYVPVPELCRVELARAVGAQAERVAEAVSLTFSPGRRVRVERILGVPSAVGGFDAEGLEVPLAGFCSEERRSIAFALRVEELAELGPVDVGLLSLRFRAVGGARHAREARVAAAVAELAGKLEPAAHALRLACSARSARSDATALAEVGRFEEARAALSQVAEEIRRAPSSANSPELSEALEQLVDDIALMEQRPNAEAQRAFRRGQRAPGSMAPPGSAMLGAALANLPRARLIFVGGEPRPEVPLCGDTLLGRTAAADVPLFSSSVSRQHTRITPGEGGFWVSDLGSSNGTLLNGVSIRCEKLKDGDLLQVGQVRILFRQAGSPGPGLTD